jgi:hypothetical protein
MAAVPPPIGAAVRARPAPTRHRGLYWAAVALALVALVGGAVVAYLSYAATSGPAGAVRGYFAALQRSDAAAALAFGDVPAGPHTYLTGEVLHVQQRMAPIHDVHIVATHRSGSTATVDVTYHLGFTDGQQVINDQVSVIRHGGSWRLAATAVSTELELTQAIDRARILGTAVPTGPVLLFPGAVPIQFDTAYLRLTPATSSVQLDGPSTTPLVVDVTVLGKTAVDSALLAAFKPCLVVSTDLTCPLPTSRAVPGTLRGTLVGTLSKTTTTLVTAGAAGVIDVTARANVDGSYQALDFNDLPVAKHGTVVVPLHATAYAQAPLQLHWRDDS